MLTMMLLLLVVGFVRETKELYQGRNTKEGEFPFIVRILIFEELVPPHHHDVLKVEMSSGDEIASHEHEPSRGFRDDDGRFDDDMHQHGVDHGGVVAAGVLITTSRVLTTCDSVGFFTGSKVTPYELDKVNVMAGSVKNTGEGGQFRTPSYSDVHPLCYFTNSVSNILFNYGVYELYQPFDSLVQPDTGIPLIQPITTKFKSQHEMEVSLFSFMGGDFNCTASGWGNQKKEFEGRGMPDHFQRFAPILQMTKMQIVDYTSCIETTCEHFDECFLNIWESGNICAKAEKGGPCIEDQAAPLVCGGEVFGIHAHPFRCTSRGLPRQFLRIDLAFDYVFGITNQGSSGASYKILGVLLIARSLHDMSQIQMNKQNYY